MRCGGVAGAAHRLQFRPLLTAAPDSMLARLPLVLLLLALIPGTLGAASFVVPTDDELIDRAEAIVVARIGSMHPRFATNRDIVTGIDVEVEEFLKGDIETPLQLVELGGIIGEQFMAASGSPVYWTDNRALIFLERDTEGNFRTYGLSLGKFDFVRDSEGNEYVIRWAHERDVRAWTPDGRPHQEPLRRASGFLDHIRARGKGAGNGPRLQSASSEAYVAAETVPDDLQVPMPQTGHGAFPPSAYMQGNFRWNRFATGGNVSFQVSGSQPGYDSSGAAQRALAAWTNDPGSNVDYRYGGTSSRPFLQDTFNTIVFNNSTDVPSGAIAYAKWYGSGTHTYKNETFFTTVEGDVVVRSGLSISQKTFDEAVTHELGHTLGFRHSDQGTPSSTQAVMKAVLTGNYGATLGPWDIEAVRTVYEGTGGDTPPTFTFTDDPLLPGTPIKAVHFTELRNAVNTFRAYAGLTAHTWTTGTIAPGVVVTAAHINEIRNALVPALQALGRATGFAETIGAGTPIRASHIQEIRNKMR